jgi:exodeoxyribonuclease X
MIIIRPCDVETTSTETDAEVIEIAAYDIRDGHLYSSGYHTLVKPAAPIPPSSSAIHHLTDVDVADAPAWNVAWRTLVELDPEYDGAEIIFAAHVASYERQFFDSLIKARWLCSWKCALRQWPDLEGHKLQELRYSLGLGEGQDRSLLNPPHRARPDAFLCGLLILRLLDAQPLETLLQWSEEPPLFTKFNFGQFDGKPLSAADDGYMDWLANKDHKMGEDWRWNAKREIERRAAAKKRAYLETLRTAIAGAATVADLEAWYHGQTDERVKHSIFVDTPEYKEIIGWCAARKAELMAAGQPQFGGAPA